MLKVHTNIIKLLFPLGWLFVMLSACSPDSTGFFSNRWHNTTARYNAYFLARQQLQEVEQQIAENHQRNFNQLLYIYPPLDTVMAKQYAEPLQEAMKTASLAIERHKNSKWVDDSYLLIGKSRFYGREFEHAIETFKFVNTKSKDDATRHRALIYLMRTFIDDQQLDNAKSVADYLRKEALNKENTRDYHLTVATLYRQREDWPQMAAHLEEAVKLTRKREGRAVYHFILGQLYQQLDKEEEAYAHFEKVLRSNPNYELSFFARLHLAQVANIAEARDEKQIRRYFSKLLRDRKNIEYRDKIYYELGNFELRQENKDAAIENYKLSTAASKNNPRQKSYAYRQLAELYYADADYKLSKAYYDSTATLFPDDEKEYALIQERQKIMTNLVTQLTTIEEQDSLLRLAAMDKPALEAYLEEVVRQEEQATALALRKNAEKITQVAVNTGFNTIEDKFGMVQEQSSGAWYFYNPSLISIGQAEFVKRWGNRPLADNWRRSQRGGRDNVSVITQDHAQEEFEDATNTETEADRIASRRIQLYESVPLTVERQQAALQEIETAFYNLGGIFNYDLKEFTPTVDAYTELLTRYPESLYRPEVLYNLYLLYLKTDEAKAAQYRDELVSRFPDSNFAKSILNPDYEREEDQESAAQKQLYARAYSQYQQKAYTQADSLLQAGLQLYPNNAFNDHLRLLRILIVGQTEGPAPYQQGLEQFIAEEEESSLLPYAKELLEASKKFVDNSNKPAPNTYKVDFDQPHYFVAAYAPGKETTAELLRLLDSYNDQEEAARKLKATNIILTENKSLVFVSQFPDKTAAMLYFRALERNNLFTAALENAGLEYFVISKDNFSVLYDSKEVDPYLSFFRKFYY